MVVGAVEDGGEASFGVEHSVAMGADADAIDLAVEFAAWAFVRGAGGGKLRVGMDVGSVAVADGVEPWRFQVSGVGRLLVAPPSTTVRVGGVIARRPGVVVELVRV